MSDAQRDTDDTQRESRKDTEKEPAVSVLMPVYNAEAYLSKALESIINQSLRDIEIILVDDGSSDHSAEIIDRYAREDARIRVVRHSKNQGIVTALNNGLMACHGTFIARMDADDISEPFRLEKQLEVMHANPDIGVLGSAVSYIDENGTPLGIIRPCALPASLLACSPLLHPTVMMRHRLLRDKQLQYEEQYRYAEDYMLWLKISQFSTLKALDEPLVQYRITDSATRCRHLRGMLVATLRAKWHAMRQLGIHPHAMDIIRFAMECLLLIMPTSLTWRAYRSVLKRKHRRIAA